MLLDKDTTQVQVLIPGVIGTGSIDVTVQYQDTIRTDVTVKTTFVSAVGPQVVIEAPANSNTARDVIELHFYNADIFAQQIQVALSHPGGVQIIQNVPLGIGDTLHYNRYNGWSIQVAGIAARGNIMFKSRSVTVSDSPVAIGLDDDIIYFDASGGTVAFVFDPAIVGSMFPGFAKEVELCKTDTSANIGSISDGTNIIAIINTPANANGGDGGSKRVSSDGTSVRTTGVG